MIAVLGWGSLCWDPRELSEVLFGRWETNGPSIPVEFCRQSNDGRLTLVIWNQAPRQQVLWARSQLSDPSQVIQSLAKREGCPTDRVGHFQASDGAADSFGFSPWMQEAEVTSVVWTNLAPRFSGVHGEAPSESQAVEYLRSLNGEASRRAREYIQNAPAQIRTPYRRAFEEQLGWRTEDAMTGAVA